MRTALLLLSVALVTLAPTASAKGILEDEATYPDGITGVTRTHVQPREEFNVLVNTDGRFDAAAMVICRFDSALDPEPSVCWNQIRASPVEGVDAFTADSGGAKPAHPVWDDGWVIGYKLTLTGPGGVEAHVPATGGEYYKVVVQPIGADAEPAPQQYDTSKAAPFCTLCFAAIGIAVVVRRRFEPL